MIPNGRMQRRPLEPASVNHAAPRRSAARVRLVLVTMGIVTALSSLSSMLLLFRAGQVEYESQLRALVKGQAHLIEAVARFDEVESQDASPAGAWLATLSQVAAGHRRWAEDASDTLTLLVVGTANGTLVTHIRNGVLLAPESPAFDAGDGSGLASANLTTPRAQHFVDAQGTAWYEVGEPIPSLGMTVLARLNLGVVHRPLREAIGISVVAGLALIGLGVVLVRRTSYGTVQALAQELERRLAAEVKLAGHQVELERAVSDRTRELQVAQDKLLEQARFATLGQVTAKVSHELRNPLSTLRTSVHSLKARPELQQPALSRILERLERNVMRCDRIIEELLAYTRPRVPAHQTVDIDGVLRALADDFTPGADVKIAWELEGELWVRVDPEDVRRIVINLLSNAVDASAPEGAQVRVVARHRDSFVCIEVIDSGSGMDADNLARACEPLFSTKSFGIGLGLSIVHELIERNGGRFVLRSEVGVGTTATVELPFGARESVS